MNILIISFAISPTAPRIALFALQNGPFGGLLNSVVLAEHVIAVDLHAVGLDVRLEPCRSNLPCPSPLSSIQRTIRV